MSALSVHDNRLVSYLVDCSARRIVLHTTFEDVEPPEYTDVVFGGVVAYHFEGDTFGTILFDVAQAPMEEILDEYAAVFRRHKNYGWPAVPHTSEDELRQALQREGILGYLLSSSYGLCGFVLAKSIEMCPAEHAATQYP